MKLAHPSRAPAKPGGVPPLIFYIMWYSPIQKGVLKMAFTPEIYPDNWSEIVKAALIRAQGVCELCGVRRGAIRRNLKTDEEYVVYLDVCHRVFYHTWKDEGVDVIEEDEVAEGFQLAFDVLPKSLKPLPFLAATP